MIAEKLSNGLSTTAIGITTVFIVLVLLWGMVELMRVVMDLSEGSSKKQLVTEVTLESKTVENTNDDKEIITAISAAIAVYMDVPQSSFKIKSFKRIGSNFKR